MNKLPSNKIMNGTFGTVWVNKEKWYDIESFEAKATANFEDVNMSEELGTDGKFVGWTGEGSIVTKKVYSRGAAIMANAIKTGVMPDIEIIGKLDDPAAFGAERVAINKVLFTELTLIKFEQKTLGTEELPFRFSDFDFLDQVNS